MILFFVWKTFKKMEMGNSKWRPILALNRVFLKLNYLKYVLLVSDSFFLQGFGSWVGWVSDPDIITAALSDLNGFKAALEMSEYQVQ